MTPGQLDGPADLRAAAADLICGLVARPGGQVSPSVYETGRLVTLAPWLTGHEQRLSYLLAAQRPDSGWGAPGGYTLIPTLSATEALLTAAAGSMGTRPDLANAAGRGLRMLLRLLPALDAASMPDTPAADLIAVSLVDAVNRHLDRFAADGPPPGLGHWADHRAQPARLPRPAGLDGSRNARIHAAITAGVRPPDKLLHALEVAGDAACGVSAVRPVPIATAGNVSTVGASPAATAAWLGKAAARNPAHPARRFLEEVAELHGGPVPCGYPITVFERAWVLATLAGAGLAPSVPTELVDSLRPALGPDGTPAGAGLPADADTTSVALYALGLLGEPPRPDPLWAYRTDTHFCTWPGEDGFSVTTNAHVLDAIGNYAARPGAGPRYAGTVRELAALLCCHQRADGSWHDRWHASPYYATACCALALHRFGGPASRPAVARAAGWLLATQHPDGSWGHWLGTTEETAYAVQVLAATHAAPGVSRTEDSRTGVPGSGAIARGCAYLLRSWGSNSPPLWHDKDLYRPKAIVHASVLAALQLARAIKVHPPALRPARPAASQRE